MFSCGNNFFKSFHDKMTIVSFQIVENDRHHVAIETAIIVSFTVSFASILQLEVTSTVNSTSMQPRHVAMISHPVSTKRLIAEVAVHGFPKCSLLLRCCNNRFNHSKKCFDFLISITQPPKKMIHKVKPMITF